MELKNPYTPSAGIMPPHLAGREDQAKEFLKLLDQDIILKNIIIMGLRGVGKTVFLESVRTPSLTKNWIWCGSGFSESAGISEDNVVKRILADLALVTSNITVHKERLAGFRPSEKYKNHNLTYDLLMDIYNGIPGLTSDKLKGVLELAWEEVKKTHQGIIFAYDEAQTMSDHANKEQFPLSVILDVFQSIQRKGARCMLALAGLPTLTGKLVAARTYTERMFQTISLGRLSDSQSREAIIKPIDTSSIKFSEQAVRAIIEKSGGYPYFLQFMCKEAFDVYIAQAQANPGMKGMSIPYAEIIIKLDKDFFSSRWTKATDRQKELLQIIAALEGSDGEFTIQEIVAASKGSEHPMGTSQVNQMLGTLINAGMIYKETHGKYCFAVPLLAEFIKRQTEP